MDNYDHWTDLDSFDNELIYNTVSKTVPITNLDAVHFTHCKHMWEYHLGLVQPNKVQTLGYKPTLGSCDLVQWQQRYVYFKSLMSLEQFCCCYIKM